MKYFSMFSGVEGFGLDIDGEAVGFSEIDKYASMVLKYHYPNVVNYGDCSKIRWEEVTDFDLLTGGSPCQDFSIAGKRRGLNGTRSSLAWEYIRCLRAKKPKYFIWENVKGVMSSRGGWDFANILSAFSESGYALWWQVLNAKDFGVPQNRERIFVVGFRDRCAPEVFFERKNDKKTDKLQGQFSNTLTARYEKAQATGTYLIESELNAQIKQLNKPKHSNERVYGKEGISPALNTMQGGNRQPFVAVKVQRTEEVKKIRKQSMIKGKDWSPFQGKELTTRDDELMNTITANQESNQAVFDGHKIRKLMPIECERLMSWPDNWTQWGMDDKGNKIEISDSQRYKMCGNGVVSNVVRELIKNLL